MSTQNWTPVADFRRMCHMTFSAAIIQTPNEEISFARAVFNPSSWESVPRLIEVILAGCGGSAPTKTLCCFFPIIYHPFVLGPCVERLMMSFFRKAVSRKCISPSIAQWRWIFVQMPHCFCNDCAKNDPKKYSSFSLEQSEPSNHDAFINTP